MPASVDTPPPRWIEPAALFARWSEHAEDVFWIDAGPDAVTGWSWIGTGVRVPTDEVRSVAVAGAGASRVPAWVGWQDYDAGAQTAGAPARLTEPASRWLRVGAAVGFDHRSRSLTLVAADDDVLALLAVAGSSDAAVPGPPPPLRVRARHTPEEYAALIEQCRDAIRAGDAYQLCLTTRFEVTGEIDAAAAFLRLRQSARTHHGAFIRIDGAALLSASPERFLEVADGTVRTSPIKGTRPRSDDDARDRALRDELLASPKERAENVMIVDLMRNDLSRVCEPASVTVESLLAVESYPAVHQLVSTISGTLREGIRFGELLDATFPAGSMSGAPKLSAMTILHRLEGGSRGMFAGCFGWVAEDGSADLAMVIRSIVVTSAGAYVGAGGGITWRSVAAEEVAEVALKARGPLAAIGGRLPADW